MQPDEQMPACRASLVCRPTPLVPEVINKPLQQGVYLIEFARMAAMGFLLS